jgi:hypothetical protein
MECVDQGDATQFDQNSLLLLAEGAIEDERLLLLVDGLGECADEGATNNESRN